MPKQPKTATETQAAKTPTQEDVALICGKTEDGKGLHILRKRGGGLETGVVQPLEEGKPLHGELVTLRQRGQSPVCDVEVHYASNQVAAAPKSPAPQTQSSASETRGHPAQVANTAYRKNWDQIWKAKAPKKSDLPN